MTVEISEDLSFLGGYALIDLGRKIDVERIRLSIRRLDTDPRHLGRDGWQSELAWLSPEEILPRPDTTLLRVGPMIVDRIEQYVPIEIHIEGVGSVGVVDWPFITLSPGFGDVSLIAERKDQAPYQPLEETEPPPPPTPPPPPPGLKPPEEDKRPPEPPRAKPPARVNWGRLALLALTVLAAGAAYVYLDPLQSLVPQKPSSSVLERRRVELIARHAPPEQFLALGQEALAAGQGDLAFRIFDEDLDSAPGNNAGPSEAAAWHLAQFYDPDIQDAVYAIQKHPEWTIYYHWIWRERSNRHAEKLRAVCEKQTQLLSRDEKSRSRCAS